MKIDGIEGKVTPPLAGEVAANNKTTTRTGNAPAPDNPALQSVDVQVSALATHMREIGARLGVGDAVDAEKVAAIKLAIAEGRYQINPDNIADRMLEGVSEIVQQSPASKS